MIRAEYMTESPITGWSSHFPWKKIWGRELGLGQDLDKIEWDS